MKLLLIALLIGLCVTPLLAQPGSGAGGYGSVGPGGSSGGPTNGQTAPQVSANIANSAILQTNGAGTNTTLGTLTVIQGAYKTIYAANGAYLRSNAIAPFDWEFHSTNGVVQYGSNTTTSVAFNTLFGNLSLNTNGAGNGGVLTAKGAIVGFSTLSAALGSFGVDASGNVTGTSFTGAIGGGNITSGTLPHSATDSSWSSITNFWGFTNGAAGVAVAGMGVVIQGVDGSGVWKLAPTNYPSGGGSAFPLSADADFNGHSGTNFASLRGQNIFVTDSANTIYTDIETNLITTGALIASGAGTVSLIPTNASVVLTSSGVPATLPFGVTNSLAGRAEPVVQYYMIDGASGVPVMTCSNETTGVKLTKGKGSLASLTETNWFTLPITSTNTIWRIRDESTGSGASVGIITNWFIGL